MVDLPNRCGSKSMDEYVRTIITYTWNNLPVRPNLMMC